MDLLSHIMLPVHLWFSVVLCPLPSQPVSSYFTIPLASKLQPTQVITQKDQTLKSISYTLYGSSLYWKQLWNNNSWIDDPNHIPENKILSVQIEKKDEELSAVLKEKLALLTPTYASASYTFNPETKTITSNIPASGFDDIYKEAGAKFGVPWQILYGIHQTESGGRDGFIMSGYGSGARGPMQFMPGTFASYATDGDGDGKTDIDNAKDAIFTAASYLAAHGSLENGLRSYGGNTAGTLSLARERGYNQ